MPKFVVGTVDELPPGSRKIVELGGRSIGVFNVKGEYFAILNRCPHQGGPLCLGNTLGFLKAEGVGQFHYMRAGEIVRCPWHGWEYDLRTGQSWFDPGKIRVRNYEVSVVAGESFEGLEKGPYVAETFPVSVEQQYVVVEVGR